MRLTKPGGATATPATSGAPSSAAAIACASSSGFLPAPLARISAAFVAASPWAGSRGGSARHPRAVEAGRQRAVPLQPVEGAVHEVEEVGEWVHARSRLSLNRRSCSSSANRSVIPAM